MGKGKGNRSGKGPGFVAAVWLSTASLLLLLLSALAARMRWNRDQLSLAGAAALFAATAAASFAVGRSFGRIGPAKAALFGLALSLLLTLTGFLIDAQAMSLMGLVRVTCCCLLGCLLGVKLGNAGSRSTPKSIQMKKRRRA